MCTQSRPEACACLALRTECAGRLRRLPAAVYTSAHGQSRIRDAAGGILKQLLRQLFRGRGSNAPAAARETGDAALRQAIRQYDADDFAGARVTAEALTRNDPHHHQAWNLLGALRVTANDYEAAVRHFERAIELQPANADYVSNCGEACRRAGWLDDAIEHCRAALAADPRHAGAGYNLALALHAVGEPAAAHAALTDALALQPDARARRSALLFLLCHQPGVSGATMLAEHQRWHELHARALLPACGPPRTGMNPDGKLRIGYVSGDFRRHSIACFIEPLLDHHDRTRFEVFCYDNTRTADDVTLRLRQCAARWRDITQLSDAAAAALITEDGIDILIDLSGHTADSRLLLFAHKPAPVQITYAGYLNTTGLAGMDYRISDGYADPVGVADAYHTERLLRMPHSQWCYRPPAPTPDVNPLPALKRGVVTFGSLHSFAKLNREVIDLWARVLAHLPGSELLIAGVPDGETHARLHAQFAEHAVENARLHLLRKVDFDEYLKLYHRVDIALDAFPYNGATTTCESLWMGVPVVTLAGAYAAARSGVSLLTSAGYAELIAQNAEQFIDIATSLARDPERLAGLRASLRARLQESPLMDETGFTRAFEALARGAFRATCARLS